MGRFPPLGFFCQERREGRGQGGGGREPLFPPFPIQARRGEWETGQPVAPFRPAVCLVEPTRSRQARSQTLSNICCFFEENMFSMESTFGGALEKFLKRGSYFVSVIFFFQNLSTLSHLFFISYDEKRQTEVRLQFGASGDGFVFPLPPHPKDPCRGWNPDGGSLAHRGRHPRKTMKAAVNP